VVVAEGKHLMVVLMLDTQVVLEVVVEQENHLLKQVVLEQLIRVMVVEHL
jgi:hypothetical protein